MRTIIALCLVISAVTFGCSGGGSGGKGGADTADSPTGINRDVAFQREAELVINDRSFVNGCDTIQCATPELTFYSYDAINDIERASCRYQCMPVEIDDSGEVRYYSTFVSFERFPNGCFERPADILFIVQVTQLCHPSF